MIHRFAQDEFRQDGGFILSAAKDQQRQIAARNVERNGKTSEWIFESSTRK